MHAHLLTDMPNIREYKFINLRHVKKGLRSISIVSFSIH